MKIARRLLQIITGRWMRRLVWLPCILLGCVVLGATLQSQGFRLAIFKNTQHRFPASINMPMAVAYTPVDNAGYAQSPQTKPPRPNSKNEVFGQPTQLGNSVGSYSSTPTRVPSLQNQSLQTPMQFPATQLPTVGQNGFNTSPIPYPSSHSYPANPSITSTYHPPGFQPNPYPTATPYATPSTKLSTGAASDNNAYVVAVQSSIGIPNQVPSSQSNALGQLADQLRDMPGADSVKLREILSQMLALAIQQFETKQNNERADLKKAKESLLRWEAAISERDSLKRSLIDSHIAQLLNSPDKLNWSFSGAQLLNGQPNQLNYQDVLSQLWPSPSNQNATSPSEFPLPGFVPTHSSYRDVNHPYAPDMNELNSSLPIQGSSSDATPGAAPPVGALPPISSLDTPSALQPPQSLPPPEERPSLPPSY